MTVDGSLKWSSMPILLSGFRPTPTGERAVTSKVQAHDAIIVVNLLGDAKGQY